MFIFNLLRYYHHANIPLILTYEIKSVINISSNWSWKLKKHKVWLNEQLKLQVGQTKVVCDKPPVYNTYSTPLLGYPVTYPKKKKKKSTRMLQPFWNSGTSQGQTLPDLNGTRFKPLDLSMILLPAYSVIFLTIKFI